MTIDQIKNFRQLGSRTAGHPEYGHATGIETTTGPLGQGFANSVGMALAERILNAQFGDDLVDHHTYVLAGDGCLMEGISQEAIALAGHLKLNKLIVFWDNNNISIDGPVSLSDSTDQAQRFAASGWNTIAIDGHDPEAIAAAIEDGAGLRPADADRGAHHDRLRRADQGRHQQGARLAARRRGDRRRPQGAELADMPPFEVPADILSGLAAGRAALGRRARFLGEAAGGRRCRQARRVRARGRAGDLPADFDAAIAAYKQKLAADKPKVATRKSSEMALEVINGVVPETIGGSADLTGSNNTKTSQTKDDHARPLCRPLRALRHPRARHGGGDERHRAAWRADPLWRHLPRASPTMRGRRCAWPR